MRDFLVKFLVFILGLFILFTMLEKIINRLLGVEKKKISGSSGKKVDQWGRGIISVIFLCTLPYFITKDNYALKWYWILFFTTSMGFQTILEWKYLKNSRQYITTLIFLIVILIIMFNIDYFFRAFS